MFFFNVLTAQMVNDLNDTQNKKPKSTLFESKSSLTPQQN